MRVMICAAALLVLLTGQALGAELPGSVREALPEAAEDFLEEVEFSTAQGFLAGMGTLWEELCSRVEGVLRQRLRGAAAVMLVVVLCGAAEGFWQGCGADKGLALLPMAGTLTITLLTAGDLDSLIGLGCSTIEDLSVFSHALLPTLAAATAAAGSLSTATVQQVTTVLLVDILISLTRTLLLPLVYLYIAVLTASCALPENRLGPLAAGLKKTVTWVLTTALVAFTLYLSVARVVTGAVDASSVRMAKAAISGAVPVVGGIISEAAETVLAGAGMLKNTIGIFGTLGILAACAMPFLQLGVQYLLYKLTAFLAAVLGAPQLCKLLDGLGGAFGLVLGMTGSCALLLLISVLTSVAAVTL